jgi:pyridoxal 5'-phosphate synthase pdxS subunit
VHLALYIIVITILNYHRYSIVCFLSRTSNVVTPPTISGSGVLQVGLAQMLKGGVIMDVVTPEEARIAEEAGAVAVMALERVPADIRKEGGVARMSDPTVSQPLIFVLNTTIIVFKVHRIAYQEQQ